jgi:nitroreductase
MALLLLKLTFRLGGVQDAIKRVFGEAISVAAAFIQLYTNSNGGQFIGTWALFNSLSQEYFTEGRFCVVIGTSSPSSSRSSFRSHLFHQKYLLSGISLKIYISFDPISF